MLTGLYIQNLAVIEKAEISFKKGFCVFTGETGAGKSIVIDAVNAVLGGRTSKDIVRTGASKAVVSAVFSGFSKETEDKLLSMGLEPEGEELILQREIFADGKSNARVCGRPITAGMLRELSILLVNIHGQHDNQALLSPERHIDILDDFADLGGELSSYRESYDKVRRLKNEIDALLTEQSQKEQQIDILSYQINEISKAGLEIGEDIELEQSAVAIRNAARITEGLSVSYRLLSGSGGQAGANDSLSEAAEALKDAAQYYSGLSEVSERLSGVAIEAWEIASELLSLLEDSSFDPSRLDLIESRITTIQNLKRKYGGSIEEILTFLDNATAKLDRLEMSDKALKDLESKLNLEQQRLIKLAAGITEKRSQAAGVFLEKVTDELSFLNMAGVKMEVLFTPVPYNNKGAEKVEFLLSANIGEPPKPLSKIASGGELSRIMLAVKNALAEKDSVPTLIFDEIDTGVSGGAAQKIGLKLKQAAQNRQILCVTHSAQVAALADMQYLIEKKVKDGRTYTQVTELDNEGRVREIARIMSPGEPNDLLLQTARQMLNG